MWSIYFNFIIFSTFYVSLNGQSDPPSRYPIANDKARVCLAHLNQTGIVIDCIIQSASKWPIGQNGTKDHEWEERDTCCQTYDEIDCKRDAINSGKCTGDNGQAALDYYQKMIMYWNTSHCLTVPYKSGLCQAQNNKTVKQLSADCINKVLAESLIIRQSIEKTWNITEQQLDGDGPEPAPIKSYCCANWDGNDWMMVTVNMKCSSDDYKIAKSQQDDLIEKLKAHCTDYPYHSKVCHNSVQSYLASSFPLIPIILSIITIKYL